MSSEIYVLDVATGELARLTSNNDVDHIPSWSPDGLRIAFTSNRSDNYDIYTMRADGSDQQLLIGLPAWDDYARWSPDGGRVAFVTTDQLDGVWNSEVFVMTIGGGRQRVTFNSARDEWPSWSPDGEWLAASSDRDGAMDIYISRADGSEVINLTDGPEESIQPAWSPDGEWIAFARGGSSGETGDTTDIWIGRRDGSEFRQLTTDGFALGPAWSPDGRYVVYSRYWDSNGDGKVDLGDAADLVAVAVDGSGATFVLTEGAEQDTSPDWTQ
jgi:TolB protein